MGVAEFPDTRWTMVLQAGRRDDPAADEALGQLCQAYWYPLYAFARRRGYDGDEARDLTQDFFTYLLEKRSLATADPERGRFRSFLLKSFQNFIAGYADHKGAAKRGGGCTLVPIELEATEGKLPPDLSHDETPERLFEREWARTVVVRVRADLQRALEREGRAAQFDSLRHFLPGYDAAASYAKAAAEMGTSEGAVKVAVHRLRRRYRDLFFAEVARLVVNPNDCAAEVQYILNALRG